MLKIKIELDATSEEDAEIQLEEITNKIGNGFTLGPGYVVEGQAVRCYICMDTKKVTVGEYDEIDEADCPDCLEPKLTVEEEMDDSSDDI